MAVSVTVLGSGSKGNCTVLASSRTKLLVDAGFSCREICRRLAAAGHDPSSIDAILISHEHSDHISAVDVLTRRFKIPVYMTAATHQGWRRYMRERVKTPTLRRAQDGAPGNSHKAKAGLRGGPELARLETFAAGRAFQIGDITVMPFTTPHDAADPVGFTFRAEGIKVGIATDLGYVPSSVVEHLRGCDSLMIESNHDLEMLRGGPYPWAVKQRVMSRVGHLSNEALAEFFAKHYDGAATFLILAHLSEQNNHPEVARSAAERALGGRRSLLRNRLMLASQGQVLESVKL
jgi:phosphoribosyl 1,2-cyclic phosphodiesterase